MYIRIQRRGVVAINGTIRAIITSNTQWRTPNMRMGNERETRTTVVNNFLQETQNVSITFSCLPFQYTQDQRQEGGGQIGTQLQF